MMASTVFQTWPCQTWPCQLPGANVVASPKIPSMPAHWYAATSVKPTAQSKTSAETTGRLSPARRLCPISGHFNDNATAWLIGDKEMTDAQAHYSGRNGRRSSDRLCVVDVHVSQAKNCGYGGGNRSVSLD